MKIIFTGHNGFLGSNMNSFWKTKGIKTVSLTEIVGKPVDISFPFNLKLLEEYDAIVHVAGKAHIVPKTKDEKEAFWKVNFEGTKNLCKAMEGSMNIPQNFIFISTVSVYGREEGENISESQPLNGNSPYALSKIEAEKWLQQWSENRGINLLIFRLPLIAGPNPPGNLDAMIHGIKTGHYFRIGGGEARKSMVLASDVANIIAKSIGREGIYNLTDGHHPSFYELEGVIASQLGKKHPRSIPLVLAKIAANAGDLLGDKFPLNSSRLAKMTRNLTFNDDKARKELGWKPQRVLDEFKID